MHMKRRVNGGVSGIAAVGVEHALVCEREASEADSAGDHKVKIPGGEWIAALGLGGSPAIHSHVRCSR